jgi:threonine synthase
LKFYSTNNKNCIVSFREALFKGIADDGGLFMPREIPRLPASFWQNVHHLSFHQIATEIAYPFLSEDISREELEVLFADAFHFEAPLVPLNDTLSILELFHGPTLAFKDFGAQFMARLVAFFNRKDNQELTILVATSGDTGSAVAHGFYNQPGTQVILLYPSGMVSEIQEKQLTTLTGNITALEVEGNFDDCQRLVKQAFLDHELKKHRNLSSANSINVARLLPQSFYYVAAYAQLKKRNVPLFISVPSGNLGNLTAGLLAREMGLPVAKFIAALNVNKFLFEYLKSGKQQPLPVIPTLSNAMDVGNPSNFARILALYQNDQHKINQIIYGRSYSDDSTRRAIREIYSKYGYIMDPHGAVGYLALEEYLAEENITDFQGIVLETAHPAKFSTAVKEELQIEIEMPQSLKEAFSKEKNAIKISNEFKDFKNFLLNM